MFIYGIVKQNKKKYNKKQEKKNIIYFNYMELVIFNYGNFINKYLNSNNKISIKCIIHK